MTWNVLATAVLTAILLAPARNCLGGSSGFALPGLVAGAGMAQVFDADPYVSVHLEYRPDLFFHGLGPWFMVGRGEHGEVFAGLGALMRIPVGPAWEVTPLFGGGYYEDAGHFDLGCKVEFRSGLEVSRRLENGWRIGAGLNHLSNGPLRDRNPGTEWAYLLLEIPFRVR